MRPLLYKMMLLFSLLSALGGVLTLIPRTGASYPNIMGYSSICTFAPAATLYCFFLAGLSCFLRASLVKESQGSAGERMKKHMKALIPLGVLLAAALAVTGIFLQVKSTYTDGTSAVSEEVAF